MTDEEEKAAEFDLVKSIMSQRAVERILSYTIPIYAMRPSGHPRAWGSGVLLRIADTSLLLSCAHVLKAAKDGDALGTLGVDGCELVELAPVEHRWTEDERVDLGFAILPQEVVDSLPREKQFLRLSDLCFDRSMSFGAYTVVGYPVETSEINGVERVVGANPIQFSSVPHQKRIDDHIEGVTISLTLDPRAVGDGDGNPARMPHLKGMSGCGIWQLAAMDKPPTKVWTPDDVKLVGIEHTLTAGTITGSNVATLVRLIRNEFPTLTASISLYDVAVHRETERGR